MLKKIKVLFVVLSIVSGIIGIISFFLIIFNNSYHFNETYKINTNLASEFGDFFGGFVGTLFSISSVFLLIYTILNQNEESQKNALENNFFRMIDYHNQNVNQLKIPDLQIVYRDKIHKERKAFVQFKIQIHKLFKIVEEINEEKGYNLSKLDIADVVFIIFYYGIEGSWVEFIAFKLERYKHINNELAEEIQGKVIKNNRFKIGRTNQTNLSTYFRNMYNAIKMIDDSKILTQKEKKNLVDIYRAQLSNPELYVIFFNVLSRFGKKWKEKKYITTYKLLKNIPNNYCDNYIPNDYFNMVYEDEEY